MKINFLKQNGVDVDKGIENTMDFETYDELLLDFCETFPQEVNKFNAFNGVNSNIFVAFNISSTSLFCDIISSGKLV